MTPIPRASIRFVTCLCSFPNLLEVHPPAGRQRSGRSGLDGEAMHLRTKGYLWPDQRVLACDEMQLGDVSKRRLRDRRGRCPLPTSRRWIVRKRRGPFHWRLETYSERRRRWTGCWISRPFWTTWKHLLCISGRAGSGHGRGSGTNTIDILPGQYIRTKLCFTVPVLSTLGL